MQIMKPKLINIEILNDYKIKLSYSNNEIRAFDFAPHLYIGRYVELQDLSLFNTAKIVSNTIEWDTEIDIDPNTLYIKSELISYNHLDKNHLEELELV